MKISLIVPTVIFPFFVGWSFGHFSHTQALAAPVEWHRYARDRYEDKHGHICGVQLNDTTLWFPDGDCSGKLNYVFTEHIMTQGGTEADKLRESGWVAE